jgi:AraC-like DNA-binding protein
VQYVSKLIERLYSKPAFGYLEFTRATRAVEDLKDTETIVNQIRAMPFPYEFADAMLRVERIEVQDIIDWCGFNREEAARLVSLLVRKQAVRREGNGYRKTSSFVAFLRALIDQRTVDRPSHIPLQGEF